MRGLRAFRAARIWRGSCTTSETMSSSKSPEALDTLEADLRSRLDEEVRTLEAYRGRLEREARVDAELARIEAVIARRVGSIPPPASASYPPSHHPASYHPASYHPASYHPAPSFHSAPPPAMTSWNPPSSMLPPAVAAAPTAQPIPYAYQTSRMVTLSTVAAMLAVIVSLTVLVITAGDRMVPSANAAERPTMSAAALANVANAASCSDKPEPAKKTDDANANANANAKSEPAAAAVAKAVSPVAGSAVKNNLRRPAAAKPAPAAPEAAAVVAVAAPVAIAPAAAAAAPAPAPAATNMDDAARTAQMLREQLSASLK